MQRAQELMEERKTRTKRHQKTKAYVFLVIHIISILLLIYV